MKKIKRLIKYTAIALFVLLLLITVLLALPPVQTFIAKKATSFLAEKTGARISIGKVAIRLPDNLSLKEIYLEDLQSDTVLYAGNLKVNISLFGLLRQKISIDNVLLEDAVVNVIQDKQDGKFNFQYLIDAFASDQPTPKDTTPSSWIFSIQSAELKHVRTHIHLSSVEIKGAIGEFSAETDEFDITKRVMDYEHVRLKNSAVAIVLPQRDTLLIKEVDTSPARLLYIMPDIGWTIKAHEIDFANNVISLDDNDKKPQPNGIDYLHLAATNVNIQISDASYVGHVLKADIGNISMKEKSGVDLKELHGSFLIDETSIRLDKLNAELNDSRITIANSAVLKFQDLNALAELSDDVGIEISLSKSHIIPADLMLFVPQLGELQSVNLNAVDSIYMDGAIGGTVGNLSAKNFICSLNKDAMLRLDFHAAGLPDIDKAVFTLNIEDFSVTPSFISSLMKTELPDEVTRLGKTNLKGKYNGTIRDMNFDGTIFTQAGNISPNLHVQFNDDYTNASYEGKVGLENFQLGHVLADTTIGNISLQANIKGKGLSLEALQADLKAEIKEATYNKYAYQNIVVDCNINKKKLTGNAGINDENVKFDFAGFIDLNDSIPDFRFEATLDTLNLQPLHFTDYNLFIRAELTGNFNASSNDNFNGRAAITNIRFGNDSLRCSLDSLVASASTEGATKTIKVESDIINATLTGDFNSATLPALFTNYLNNYFPIGQVSMNAKTIPDQNFNLVVTVSKPLDAVRVFLPQISEWDTASVTARFDNRAKLFHLKAEVPGVIYDSIAIETISILSSGNKDTLNFSVTMVNADYNGQMKVPLASLYASASNNILNLDMTIDSDSIRRLGMAASISGMPENRLRVNLKDGLIINDEKWTVSTDNFIDYRAGFLHVHHLDISERNQKISISSPQNTSDIINIAFNEFDLRELSDFAGFYNLALDGNINGSLTLNDIFSKPSFTADMSVNDIAFNQNPVGDLRLNAFQQGDNINVKMELTGDENDLAVTGKVFPQSGTMNLDINMKRLNLSAADPFLKDYFKDSKGYFTAQLTAEGAFAKPSLNGNISLRGISTFAVYPNARYTFADSRIDVSADRITVHRMEAFDEQNRKVTLDGFMSHDYFTNINFDMKVNSDEFLFMNTPRNNDFFYGKILLGVNAHLTGTPESPVVEAKVSTKPGTSVSVQPLTQKESIKQEDFVLFQSPPFDVADEDSVIAAQLQYKARVTGIDLRLAFELTPDAELQIIIDPFAGDKLVCKGAANLSVYIPPAGIPQVNGSYIVESGEYSFSYQRFLKLKFEITKGSRIDFAGDIMDALLDINTTYTAKASTYELISAESASMSASEISAAKKRVPVDVILKIRGEIANPELTYDIRLLENMGNITSSAVERKLMQLRQDQAELSKQVVALLVFKSFMADYSTGGTDWGIASANVALQSVSGMISNQLSRLSALKDGLEVNIDLTSFQDEFSTGTTTSTENVTEMGFDISQKFLNDRLEVSVGGNVNLDNSASGQSGDVSNITGDFAIEYKLTDNGKYRVKVFRTGNYDMVNQSNVYRTGVGLTYRHSFRSVLPKRKEEREKKKEAK